MYLRGRELRTPVLVEGGRVTGSHRAHNPTVTEPKIADQDATPGDVTETSQDSGSVMDDRRSSGTQRSPEVHPCQSSDVLFWGSGVADEDEAQYGSWDDSRNGNPQRSGDGTPHNFRNGDMDDSCNGNTRTSQNFRNGSRDDSRNGNMQQFHNGNTRRFHNGSSQNFRNGNWDDSRNGNRHQVRNGWDESRNGNYPQYRNDWDDSHNGKFKKTPEKERPMIRDAGVGLSVT